MPRPLRIDYPGAFHHVMARGARRAPIFAKPEDCLLLLDTFHDAVSRFGVEVHGYSLMPNHYHLLLRSVNGDLSRVMKFINGQFTMRLNRRHQWDGPVFRGRYHNQLVSSPRHLRVLLPYLHLNPVRAHLAANPEEECWTSHRAYLQLERRPDWLATRYFSRLLGGKRGLTEIITGLHQGKIAWPSGFNLDSGLFDGDADKEEEGEKVAAPAMVAEGAVRPTLRDALARICEISGATQQSLREPAHGPGANPARRFAVWALVHRAALTHEETGRCLRMSTTAVSKVASRTRVGTKSAAVVEWMKCWDKPE